jgi:hypothetical protein
LHPCTKPSESGEASLSLSVNAACVLMDFPPPFLYTIIYYMCVIVNN